MRTVLVCAVLVLMVRAAWACDTWDLEPVSDQAGVYEFRYWNSTEQCSNPLTWWPVTSSDGLLTIHISVLVSTQERIIVQTDAAHLPVPPELWLDDGEEPGSILIYPAMF